MKLVEILRKGQHTGVFKLIGEGGRVVYGLAGRAYNLVDKGIITPVTEVNERDCRWLLALRDGQVYEFDSFDDLNVWVCSLYVVKRITGVLE